MILGGYDAEVCAELLKQHDIPVIVDGVYRLPVRRNEAYDEAYTLPERLRMAGVTYCIAGGSRRSASNVRNLPYHAATAAAYGLPHDEALKAITLYPARICGLADRVGSLEVGKDATLIITDGDILETPTHVETAFVQGRQLDLSDRHKRLYQKYQQRLEQVATSGKGSCHSPIMSCLRDGGSIRRRGSTTFDIAIWKAFLEDSPGGIRLGTSMVGISIRRILCLAAWTLWDSHRVGGSDARRIAIRSLAQIGSAIDFGNASHYAHGNMIDARI